MKNKQELKYIAFLVSTVLAFVLVEIFAPKPTDWTVTLSKKDKIPFGTYILHELLKDFTEQKKILHSYNTLYELQNEITNQNIFILCQNFTPDKIDTDVLLNKVDSGATAFISAQYFSGQLVDTLNLEIKDNVFDFDIEEELSEKDTAKFQLVNPLLDDVPSFIYLQDNFPTYFSSFDSTKSTIVIRDTENNALGIKINHGKGSLYLSTIPMAFTNNYLLTSENHKTVAGLLSYLPERDLFWTEYYQLGRMESGSPLRFIFKTPALRWAYYVALITTLVFLLFETKRRQRIIPIVKPYPNASLEFVVVIGNLYFQNNDHKKIGDKRITFFLEQIRQKYFIKKIEYADTFYEMLAAKSGNDLKKVADVFNTIEKNSNQNNISAEDLHDLSSKIDQFY